MNINSKTVLIPTTFVLSSHDKFWTKCSKAQNLSIENSIDYAERHISVWNMRNRAYSVKTIHAEFFVKVPLLCNISGTTVYCIDRFFSRNDIGSKCYRAICFNGPLLRAAIKPFIVTYTPACWVYRRYTENTNCFVEVQVTRWQDC